MKVTKTTQEPEFTPFTVELHVETPKEAAFLRSFVRANVSVPDAFLHYIGSSNNYYLSPFEVSPEEARDMMYRFMRSVSKAIGE